ncbi:hypothetical protein K438DRAFT_1780246 [Mycena galopus ATCC 62051]|nr:hypothetical protein K438DRAFT_1780246 [Mycena galopus ATCC 62051]
MKRLYHSYAELHNYQCLHPSCHNIRQDFQFNIDFEESQGFRIFDQTCAWTTSTMELIPRFAFSACIELPTRDCNSAAGKVSFLESSCQVGKFEDFRCRFDEDGLMESGTPKSQDWNLATGRQEDPYGFTFSATGTQCQNARFVRNDFRSHGDIYHWQLITVTVVEAKMGCQIPL